MYWYHNDVSGMPRELTGAGGEIAWRAEYRVWANTLRVEHIATRTGEPVYQPLRYQGQYFDAGTGLHYNRFRYYDPDAGRFISQDPPGFAGGINLYQYAANPLVWVDPLGLAFRHVPLTEGVVYRQGSNTPANMTPRPGKDTNPLKKPGLSTTIEKPSGKSIPLMWLN
ncbi:RHS repeat-associated core domain-containing protein [Cronobacter dublinensis]